jgi:predicted DNA-binding protein with PD1-like motif
MIVVSVTSGEEVIETVTRKLKEAGVTDGAIVSVVGAVESCCISNMPKADAKQDILTEYYEPFELSGTGEVKNGVPHIHCTLGTEGNGALSGHMHWARVDQWFVNVYVIASA